MSNPASDPKKGGDLNDMAATGATIPGDAGKMNLLPSVPNPHQEKDAAEGMGQVGIAAAADNAVDIPRDPSDAGAGLGEGVTGTGHAIRPEVDTKNAHLKGPDNPLAKGSVRYGNHQRQEESELQPRANEHDVAPAPDEEGENQDVLLEKRDAA